MHIHILIRIYIHLHIYMHIYIYIHIQCGGGHALCDEPVNVIPGEFIRTRIVYDPDDGSLDISIGPSVRQANGTWADVKDRRSHIVSARPFPNSSPPLYESWGQLFKQALVKSQQNFPDMSLLCRPELNIEYKGSVRLETLAALCPFKVASPKVNGGKHINTYTYTHMYTHSGIRIYTHTHTHPYSHTHIYIHTQCVWILRLACSRQV
jgi:hypothetical protein